MGPITVTYAEIHEVLEELYSAKIGLADESNSYKLIDSAIQCLELIETRALKVSQNANT